MDTTIKNTICGLKLHNFYTIQVFEFQEGYETLDAAGSAHNFLYVRRYNTGIWEGYDTQGMWNSLGQAETKYLESQWELLKPKLV